MLPAVKFYTYAKRFEEAYAAVMPAPEGRHRGLACG